MKVRLRKIKEQDLEKIRIWRMDPNVSQYMYSDPVLTTEDQKCWFANIQDDENCMYWIIEADNIDIGVLCIDNIDRTNLRCDWAYYIADTSCRGKGIGTLLECNVYDYVFYNLNMNKLCCEVFCFNEKVILIHQKFGSEIEGTRKKHIYKKGVFYDIVEMAILKEKWGKTKYKFQYDKIEIEEK